METLCVYLSQAFLSAMGLFYCQFVCVCLQFTLDVLYVLQSGMCACVWQRQRVGETRVQPLAKSSSVVFLFLYDVVVWTLFPTQCQSMYTTPKNEQDLVCRYSVRRSAQLNFIKKNQQQQQQSVEKKRRNGQAKTLSWMSGGNYETHLIYVAKNLSMEKSAIHCGGGGVRVRCSCVAATIYSESDTQESERTRTKKKQQQRIPILYFVCAVVSRERDVRAKKHTHIHIFHLIVYHSRS